jgi:lysophospholipase L1-like esterase
MNTHTSLALSLFTACAFALVAAAEEPVPPPSDPVEPVPRDRDFSWMPKAEWDKQHAEFSAIAAQGEAKLVFHGDSLLGAARWSEAWKKEFGRYNPAFFGMGGDRTQNLLWRLENGEIGNLRPKVVVLLIGTNNIHTTPRDAEDTARGIVACARKLNAAYPEAKILVLGVFPRDEDPSSAIRPKIKKINELVAAIDDGKSIFVRDIGALFLEPDGRLPRDLSPDQLHLKEEGLKRWAEAIAPFIHENMK